MLNAVAQVIVFICKTIEIIVCVFLALSYAAGFLTMLTAILGAPGVILINLTMLLPLERSYSFFNLVELNIVGMILLVFVLIPTWLYLMWIVCLKGAVGPLLSVSWKTILGVKD